MKNQFIKEILSKINITKYKLEEVFTPATSAKLTFVKRDEIDKQIQKALMIPGMQLIVYGHSGSGKTTITQNILFAKKTEFIVTNCIIDTKVNELILDAFDKLNPFYTTEKSSTLKTKIASELKASYVLLDATLKSEIGTETTEKSQRALPIQLTPQRLAEFLGAASVVWIIEDFHKVAVEERQKLSQILKIFVDTSNKYSDVKVIAIGAVGTAREVVNYDQELSNRISEIHVPLMTKEELEGIITKGESLLKITFDKKVHTDVIHFSNSLASICHHLCFSICFNNQISTTQKVRKKIKNTSLTEAVLDYLKQNSDSFKECLDRALKPRDGKFDDTKQVLQCFCNEDSHELAKKDLMRNARFRKKYGSTIDEYLKLLTTAEYGEILRYDDNSGKYSFLNPFVKAYTIMQLSMETKDDSIDTIEKIDFEEFLKYITITFKDENIKLESVVKTNFKPKR